MTNVVWKVSQEAVVSLLVTARTFREEEANEEADAGIVGPRFG